MLGILFALLLVQTPILVTFFLSGLLGGSSAVLRLLLLLLYHHHHCAPVLFSWRLVWVRVHVRVLLHCFFDNDEHFVLLHSHVN